jgi:hypothetical protein
MLTLGLMEGIFAATAMVLVLYGLCDAGVPLHRIFAPPAVALVGFAAYFVWREGAIESVGDIAGLLAAASIGLFLPLAGLRWAWKAAKRLQPVSTVTSAAGREIDLRDRPPAEIDLREPAPVTPGVVSGRIDRTRTNAPTRAPV